MQKRKFRLAALCLALLFFTAAMAGCAADPQEGNMKDTTAPTTAPPASTTPVGLQRLMGSLTGGLEPRPVDTKNALNPAALDAVGDFAAALLRESLSEEGKNTLVSPLSVLLALGMTANGAGGDTLTAFEQTLGGGKLSLEALNLLCRSMSDTLRDTGGSTELHIANGIWFSEAFEPDAAFLQANADYFGAEARRAPFNQDTVDEINAWVSENTRELIPSVIDQLDPMDVMVLVNTLYMHATWQRQFNAGDTHKGVFTLAGGDTVETDFMSNDGRGELLLSDGGAKGVLLPYDDEKLAYVAVLPPEGVTAAEYAASLDGGTLGRLLDSKRESLTLLRLPKYEASYDITLNDPLAAMGLGVAFDAGRADFSRMGQVDVGDLYIGVVQHKTVIKVEEKGTEAAAVTSVTIRATSAPAVPPEELVFDRPFVYAVVDLETALPLFLGVLETPME